MGASSDIKERIREEGGATAIVISQSAPAIKDIIIFCVHSSKALLSQIDHQRLGLVCQIGAIVGPVFVVFVDEGKLKSPDYSGKDETGFREEGPVSHEIVIRYDLRS